MDLGITEKKMFLPRNHHPDQQYCLNCGGPHSEKICHHTQYQTSQKRFDQLRQNFSN